jgi:hypothetical protein
VLAILLLLYHATKYMMGIRVSMNSEYRSHQVNHCWDKVLDRGYGFGGVRSEIGAVILSPACTSIIPAAFYPVNLDRND